MNRTALTLGAVFALAMLGACAPYGVSDGYYGGGGGYYEQDYYGPGYSQPTVPYGAYGGGYDRDHRGGDRGYRGQDHNRSDRNQGDRQGRQGNYRGNNQNNAQADAGSNTTPNSDRITRGHMWQQNQAQQNAAPLPSNGAG